MFKKSTARLKIYLAISCIFLFLIVNLQSVKAADSDQIFIGPASIRLGELPAPILEDETVVGIRGIRTTIHVEIFGAAQKVWVVSDEINYELKYDPLSNLWFGFIEPENEGMYDLEISAKDIQERIVSKRIGSIYFYNSGKILVEDELNTTPTTVTLYYRKDSNFNWSMWNGAEVGQRNPIFTEESGEYSFLVEKGEYYFSASKAGYRTRQSTIFKVEESSVINSDIFLQPSGLFDFFISIFDSFKVDAKELSNIKVEESQVSFTTSLEVLKLKNANRTLPLGSILDSKPGVISFWSTWGLQSPEQIYQLSRLTNDDELKEYKILTVGVSNDYSLISKIVQKGNYIVNLYILDSYSELKSWELVSTPYYIFLDKEGQIVDVIKGKVLSTDEIKLKLIKIK